MKQALKQFELESRTQLTLVIFNPPDDVANKLIKLATSRNELKLILTLTTPQKIEPLDYNQDTRLKTLKLQPLNHDQAEQLLIDVKFHFATRDWVITQAGGNPGILIFASSLGAELKQKSASFTNDIAETFKKHLIKQLNNDDQNLDALKLLSLLTFIGVKGEAVTEIKSVVDIFGSQLDTTLNKLLGKYLPMLIETGVVRENGPYVEVSPPIFANHLTANLIQGNEEALVRLFSSLDNSGQLRLATRLRQLNNPENVAFWKTLLAPEGLLGSWDILNIFENLYYPQLLQVAAIIIPEQTLSFIQDRIAFVLRQSNIPKNHKCTIADRLTNVLKELLLDSRTYRSTLDCLSALTELELEAETEDSSDKLGSYNTEKTSRLFCQFFNPHQPFISTDLDERIAILKEYLLGDYSIHTQLLALNAVETALGRVSFYIISRSNSLELKVARFHNGAFGDYFMEVISLTKKFCEIKLISITLDNSVLQTSSDSKLLLEKAGRLLPKLIANGFWLTNSLDFVEELLSYSYAVFTKQDIYPYSFVSRASLIPALHNARNLCKQFKKKSAPSPEARTRLEKCLVEIQNLLELSKQGDYLTRLQRWIGEWTQETEEIELAEVVKLSEEAINALPEHELLGEKELNWLYSLPPSKKASLFFRYLGEADQNKLWLAKSINLGSTATGWSATADYWVGLAKHSLEFVHKKLDELALNQNINLRQAVLNTTSRLEGCSASVSRLLTIKQDDKISEESVSSILENRTWLKGITVAEFSQLMDLLLNSIYGTDNPGKIANIYSEWLHTLRALPEKLNTEAWQLLEQMSLSDIEEANKLACLLVPSDYERGFELLKLLVIQSQIADAWNPLLRYSPYSFYLLLYKVNPEKTMGTVIEAALLLEGKTIYYISLPFVSKAISQKDNSEYLLKKAKENLPTAIVIARSLQPYKTGFWPLAISILEKYPYNKKLQEIFIWKIQEPEGVLRGTELELLENKLKEIKDLREQPDLVETVKYWLETLTDQITTKIEQIKERNKDIY